MQSVLYRSAIRTTSPACPARALRSADVVCLAYFSYLAILGVFRSASLGRAAILMAIPILLWGLWRTEVSRNRSWGRVVRDWSSLALILIGYWLLEWFSKAPVESLQAQWVEWDRALLGPAGLRRAIESAGPVLPGILESLYLMLYAIPPIALGITYATNRERADIFLRVLFLGTFTAYALLPLVQVASPREAFPGVDLPCYSGLARQLNTWLLDHLDISTSGFPSGHVAVAFSSAFGLAAVIPERRWILTTAFVIAAFIYIATVYGRYHYAVDGLASILIISSTVLASKAVSW